MAYNGSKDISQALNNLRMMWRHCDNVIMCIKQQGWDNENELVERVQDLQDNIAVLTRDLRATTKEPGA